MKYFTLISITMFIVPLLWFGKIAPVTLVSKDNYTNKNKTFHFSFNKHDLLFVVTLKYFHYLSVLGSHFR